MALPVARKEEADVIQAQSLATTTSTQVAAAVAGLGGAVTALLPVLGAVDVPVRLQVAGLLVIGLALIAWGIATAGDALARAYATAHIGVSGIQNDGSDAKKPALAAAVQRLAEAHENATFGVSGIQKDGSDAKKPALAEALKELSAHEGAGAERQLIHAAKGLTHNDGEQEHKVAALLFSPRTGVVQQLYFDASGQPRLTEPLEVAP